MRLTRLALERYGHVSGEWLEFPAAFGLHVVLGANEAGKSTALEAVADGLFGFPTRGRSKLSHPDDPRVGFTLRSADGTEASFLRRKTGRDKLLDGSGAPLPEAALARFLGGNGRERFQDVFGLNAERLREAGRTIMAEQGEAGAAILQAQTGLRGLRATVDDLDEQAKQLFGDGRGQRRISAAVTAVKENRKLVADRSVSGPDYLRVHAQEAELAKQLEKIDEERRALRTEQARLTRVRSTAPFRAELADLAAKLEAIGPPVPLPPDAPNLYVTAVNQRDQAARDRLREEGELEVIGAKLAQLQPDRSILREADAIAALEADLSRIADARRDYLRVSGQATASVAAADEFARRLGVAERGSALRHRLPDIVTRRAAATLLGRYALDVAARDSSEEALTKLEQEAEAAEQALSECPAVADAERLRDAVEEVQTAGPIDADLAKAGTLRDKLAAEAERSLVKLALWTGDLAALEATSVPLEAEAARLGTVLEDATARRHDTETELDGHDAAAETCQVEMRGIEAMGTLPTEDAVAAVRARRDLAWRLLRHAIINGGSLPAPEAWAGETPTPPDLPSHFETLLREADAMADARHGELARVQKWERLRDQAAELTNQRPRLLNARDAARQHAHSAQIAWSKAWTPAGVEPLSPAAMREWVRDRAAVLAAAATARDAAEAYGSVAKRQAYLRDILPSVLPSSGGADLAPMMREAVRMLRQLDEQATQRGAAAERLTRAIKDLADARRTHTALDARGKHWAGKWEPVAQKLGLPLDADPNAATDLIAIWSDLDKELDREREFQARLTEMRAAIVQHDEAVAALATRLEVPVTETLVIDLAERRRHAEKVGAEQTRLEKEGAEHAEAMAEHQRAEASAEAQLSVLRKSACVEDEAGLKAAIEAESRRAELTRQQQDRAAVLRSLSDGRTEAELAAEATALDIDAVPGRLEAILARTTTLDAEASAGAGELVQARQELRAMQAGQDVAGPAQVVHDSLAAIEDDAHRYVRLRLAHALLRGGIDGYRRSQQGPLLAKASTLFAELTGERYARLEQDESEKGEPFLVAVRPDGSTCPAGSLSEGTTDQLFLALRLASIALDAAVSEPLPFIADDLLVNFDDARAAAALSLLAEFGRTSQVILFTHHKHLLDLLAPGTASIHDLPRDLAA